MNLDESDCSDSPEKLSAILCGVSGEYFVAAELSRRGYIASITLRNSRGVDILASNSEATRTVAIQVKTSQGTKPTWILSEKSETFFSASHFYVFVRLNGTNSAPEYFVVPSSFVADHTKTTHSTWLATPGKGGRIHQDSPVRKFSDPERKFLNKWELLGLDS